MKYEFAPDLQAQADEISRMLFPHVIVERVKCFRSYGSSSRNTIARCHTIGKLMQKALNIKAHYVIEFLEAFEKLEEKEKLKVIIHELMHIPKTFGGGFKHHDYVCAKNINAFYRKYETLKDGSNEGEGKKWW
ncbi:metallopeptidase [Candidatus Pacearchaeota archaeon CG10_big_fil_rev_8_21_14_0_10_34_12]|nr:MAG: metallopeptidase [Candidatus Pacearchaeota archaeon CG10_big_fil_rev_8_21_14_0_10_34_12]